MKPCTNFWTYLLVAVCFLALWGCSSDPRKNTPFSTSQVQRIYDDEGQAAWWIGCPGGFNTMGSCFGRANALCPTGFHTLETSEKRTGSFSTGMRDAYGNTSVVGGPVVSRYVIVRCGRPASTNTFVAKPRNPTPEPTPIPKPTHETAPLANNLADPDKAAKIAELEAELAALKSEQPTAQQAPTPDSRKTYAHSAELSIPASRLVFSDFKDMERKYGVVPVSVVSVNGNPVTANDSVVIGQGEQRVWVRLKDRAGPPKALSLTVEAGRQYYLGAKESADDWLPVVFATF